MKQNMYHFRVHCKVLELEQRKCRSQRMRTKLQNSQPCNATYAAFVYNRIRVDVVRVRYSVAVNTVADCQMPSTAASFDQRGKSADKKKCQRSTLACTVFHCSAFDNTGIVTSGASTANPCRPAIFL